MRAFLYVSTRQMPSSHLRDLVMRSQTWNLAAGITGALVSTNRHFVQFIEGPNLAMRTLIAKLRHDPRHSDIVPLMDMIVDDRKFSGWSLAYSSSRGLLDERLALTLESGSSTERRDAVDRLLMFMRAMVRSNDQHDQFEEQASASRPSAPSQMFG